MNNKKKNKKILSVNIKIDEFIKFTLKIDKTKDFKK